MSNTPAQQHLANNKLSHEEENILRNFSELMEARMVEGALKGFGNWQSKFDFPDHKLRIAIVKAVREADWVSVGSYAMMAQHRGLEVVNPANTRLSLPRSILLHEELDRDFVNIWARGQLESHTRSEFPCPGEIEQAEAKATATAAGIVPLREGDNYKATLEEPLLHPEPDHTGDVPQRPTPPVGTIRTEGLLKVAVEKDDKTRD